MAPIAVGLLLAGSLVLARGIDTDGTRVALTLATAAVAVRSRANPLWLIAAGGLLGLTGWVIVH